MIKFLRAANIFRLLNAKRTLKLRT